MSDNASVTNVRREGLQWQLVKLIATFFYSGLLPKMPGTWGSLVALPFAWLLWGGNIWLGIFATAAVFLVGTWAAHYYCNATGKHDNQEIVVDEAIGIFIVTSIASPNIWSYVVAFICFRLFDITKPFPVRWLDRNIPGGLGVIVDDIAAAVWALVPMFLFERFALPLLN